MGELDVTVLNPVYCERKHERRRAVKRCVIVAAALVATAMILLGLLSFVVWLVLRPIQSPSWVVDDVQVITVNLQSRSSRRRLAAVQQEHDDQYSTSSPETDRHWGIQTFLLNADIVVTLRACNPNRHLEVIYDRIAMHAAYATARFGGAALPGFTQRKSNVTHLATEVKAMSVPVTYNLGDALQADIRNGNVAWEIFVDARARVKIGGYRSFGFSVTTACDVTTTTPTAARAGQTLTTRCHGA